MRSLNSIELAAIGGGDLATNVVTTAGVTIGSGLGTVIGTALGGPFGAIIGAGIGAGTGSALGEFTPDIGRAIKEHVIDNPDVRAGMILTDMAFKAFFGH